MVCRQPETAWSRRLPARAVAAKSLRPLRGWISSLPGSRTVRSSRRRASDETLPLANEQVAARLDEVGGLLETQGANPFRVRAYRSAAETLRSLRQPAHEILQHEGLPGLIALPGIGLSLARSIEQLAHTGRLGLLERLHGGAAPERLLVTVAGIGPELAARIHEQLGIETLEELEAAAYDGRLGSLSGMGAKRIRAVRESLAGRFRRG